MPIFFKWKIAQIWNIEIKQFYKYEFFFLKKRLRFYSRSIFLKIESAGLTIQDPVLEGKKNPTKNNLGLYIISTIIIYCFLF